MLGLPWPEWGETDVLLAMARREVDASTCACGCGHDASVAHDPDTDGRWQVDVTTCYAGQTLADFQAEHSSDMGSGDLVGVRLLPEGEEPSDPMMYDPSRAAEERRMRDERLGIASEQT